MTPELFFLQDDGRFPNSRLPAVCFRNAVNIPPVFAYRKLKAELSRNNWKNAWKSGIFTFHHYHSTTHEALIALAGSTVLQLGGENGETLAFSKGDLLVIPAGVAHKNLGSENDISCLGAYPNGDLYDMNYGKEGERPAADLVIATVKIPASDPLPSTKGKLVGTWQEIIA
jgi:uncharacterized protein YjlB